MSTIPKPFLALSLASLLLALAWLAQGWAASGLEQARSAQQGLQQTRAQLDDLQLQIQRWEALAQRSVARVEPVALDASFLPSEMLRSAQLLAGLYADHGHFRLEHFTLSWGEAEGAAAAHVQMAVRGQKVFTAAAAPVSPAAAAPGAAAPGTAAPAAATRTGAAPATLGGR